MFVRNEIFTRNSDYTFSRFINYVTREHECKNKFERVLHHDASLKKKNKNEKAIIKSNLINHDSVIFNKRV